MCFESTQIISIHHLIAEGLWLFIGKSHASMNLTEISRGDISDRENVKCLLRGRSLLTSENCHSHHGM